MLCGDEVSDKTGYSLATLRSYQSLRWIIATPTITKTRKLRFILDLVYAFFSMKLCSKKNVTSKITLLQFSVKCFLLNYLRCTGRGQEWVDPFTLQQILVILGTFLRGLTYFQRAEDIEKGWQKIQAG